MQNPVPQIQKTGRFDETGVLGKIEQKNRIIEIQNHLQIKTKGCS